MALMGYSGGGGGGAGGTPGGSTGQVQYNNAGAFGGMSGTSWDDTNRALTVTGATVTTSKPVFDLSQTWNGSGVTFTGFKLNVTNTASANASSLVDIQVGGATAFSVHGLDKSIRVAGGFIYLSATWGSAPYFGIDHSWMFYQHSSGAGGLSAVRLGLGTNYTASTDIVLERDGAGLLAQRNGTSAQESRTYYTYTDASNYQRANIKNAAGAIEFAAESAGTGGADIDVKLTPKGSGVVQHGTHAVIGIKTVTGYITIKDSGGTTRYLAVVS